MTCVSVCASTKQGAYELDLYLSNKHDELLAKTFQPETYKKRFSWVIVDGFSVEITDDQVNFSLIEFEYHQGPKTWLKPICTMQCIKVKFLVMINVIFFLV